MQPKLIVTFERLNDAHLMAKSGLVIVSMTDNSHFPLPWPAPAPSLTNLNTAQEAYCAAVYACATRDTLKIEQRNAAREVLTGMLRQLASYLEFVAHGDVAALASTGFDLRRDLVRNGVGPLPAPEGFRLRHGASSGSVDVRFGKLLGAASYEVQITHGDPTLEDNWRHAAVAPNTRSIVLSGLPLAQKVWVRVRGVRLGSEARWTEPVGIIVV